MDGKVVAAMPAKDVASPTDHNLPWYRQVSGEQWRAFWATFIGWIVDAFDFNILSFILIDIQHSFTVNSTLAGLLATVTLLMRLVGGVVAGTAADRWGRKLPMLLSILWFSLFAFLSGFSSSYAMLFGFRALFGIGMGGEWAAGMTLVIEHWPVRLRGLVSGMLLGGWYWGYLLAAAAFQFIYPLFSDKPDLGWRVMFWIAIIPAFFTLWIRSTVSESPVWLDRQKHLQTAAGKAEAKISVVRIFQHDLIMTTIQTTAVIGAFMCAFYSIAFWYPTFLRANGRETLPYLIAFNLGAIGGTIFWGRLSEGKLGRRGAVTITALLGVASIPLYLHGATPVLLAFGALTMGAFGSGIWGMAPAYVAERYPTAVRGVGPGFCYHAAAGIGAAMPPLIGLMRDRGMPLATAMTIAIGLALLFSAGLMWFGPETRGRELTAETH
jgi:SHS family lactate transporter-like MFS transporter